MQNIAIIGASGSIGQAITLQLAESDETCQIYAGTRQDMHWEHDNIHNFVINPLNEQSIAQAAAHIDNKLDMLVITIGMLHDRLIQPEKSIRQLDFSNMQHVFAVNTFAPGMLMKYFLPKLHKDRRTVCAALSARVGSIGDNRLGGWYSYRASKAALNMLIKSASIEQKRSNANSIVVGLHPGTVDSHLSKPFQANVPDSQLFSARQSAEKLVDVLRKLKTNDSGRCFDYAYNEIIP